MAISVCSLLDKLCERKDKTALMYSASDSFYDFGAI